MIEDLQELLDNDPFVPFRIVLSSGGFYEVQSPDEVLVRDQSISYFYRRSDRFAYLSAIDVIALETLENE